MSNVTAPERRHRGTSPAACAILTGALGAIGSGVIALLMAVPTWLVALSAIAGFTLAAGMVWMAIASGAFGGGGGR